jgi:protein-tyrosine-phosphatase
VRQTVLILSQNNKCRGYVAAKILESSLLKNKFKIISAGVDVSNDDIIDPKAMDFLKYHRYNQNSCHIPQKLTDKMLKISDVIFCFDQDIIDNIKKKFLDIKNKIKTFNSPDPESSVQLPKNSSEEKFNLVMKNILFFSLIWADYLNLKEQ